MSRTILPVLALVALVGAAAVHLAAGSPDDGPASSAALPSDARDGPGAASDAPPTVAGAPGAPGFDRSVRWIAAGGGPTPELNQVSIEADLGLVREALGPGGVVLFAGGPETQAVQVRSAEVHGGLLQRLGVIFSPRGGRDAVYRRTALTPDGPATREAILEAVDGAVARGSEPLLIYLAGHGDRGERPRDVVALTWGDDVLRPDDLAHTLDAASPDRRIRVVVTSCFGGGFSTILYTNADPSAGAAAGDRCGLFASTWDAEASGCDPDPDRRAHDGYGMHLVNALRGRDRQGQPLAPGALDLDGDGRISLLEAHTRARVAMRALGVPTTTSEAWLRAEAPAEGPEAPAAEVPLPEEDAVVRALGRSLGLVGREGEAAVRLRDLKDGVEAARRIVDEADRAEQDAYRAAAARLLSRWPVLDDPWHPDFADLVRREEAAITRALDTWSEVAALEAAGKVLDRATARVDELERRAAPYERLARAVETRTLARRLAAKGGAAWDRYRRLLACERSAP